MFKFLFGTRNKPNETPREIEEPKTVQKTEHWTLEVQKDAREERFNHYRSVAYLNTLEKSTKSMLQIEIKGKFKGETGDPYLGSNYDIRINDCHSNINLHGRLLTHNDRINALYKFDTLIHQLENARVHLRNEFNRNNLEFEPKK